MRLYKFQALLQERCCACSSDAPDTMARTRSAASSTGACKFAGQLESSILSRWASLDL